MSETGRFHIDLLRLNRPQLLEQRLRRRLARLLAETHRLLVEENKGLRLQINNLEEYLRQLHLRFQTESSQQGS